MMTTNMGKLGSKMRVYGPGKAELDKYLPLVEKTAYLIHRKIKSYLEYKDLVQEGVIGLITAIKDYDPEQGASIKTYISIRVRGAILDAVRKAYIGTKTTEKKIKKIRQAITQIENEQSREARYDEIHQRTEIDHKMLCLCLQYMDSKNFRGLTIQDEDIIGTNMDSDPLDLLKNARDKKKLVEALKRLPERNYKIINLYYMSELNSREIGVLLHISESRVSQLLSEARMELKKYLNRKLENSLAA